MHHITDTLHLACLPRSSMLIYLYQLDDPFDRQFILLFPRALRYQRRLTYFLPLYELCPKLYLPYHRRSFTDGFCSNMASSIASSITSYIAKKEHGIYNYGIEIWKSCTSCHQVLRACCFPPCSAAVPSNPASHHCSTRMRNDHTTFGLVRVPSRRNATIFTACKALRAMLTFLPKFQLFRLFDSESYGWPTINIGLSFLSLDTTVAADQPSDAPELLITSILCGCCCSHCCRQNPTSREEILALRNPATSQHYNTAPAPSNHQRCRRQRRRRHMVCWHGIWNSYALCDGWTDRCLQASGRCLVEEGGNVTGWALPVSYYAAYPAL